MITFMESKETSDDGEKCLDSQLWHACAGSMVQLPAVNSKVFYFPQGHGEHASGNVDFRACPKVPSYIPCRVCVIKFLADSETDEVYAKMRLFPLGVDELESGFDDGVGIGVNGDHQEKPPASFAKTLTQSDANNGGGFSVPRYCAETIFPRLDYTTDPPVQTILAKDVHGEIWKFRHIYRGTPRRHLLTTGWSTFVNHKKLVAGDSIVFMRAENGDLCVGIRRAKRGIGSGPEMPTGWNPGGGNSVSGFSAFMRENGDRLSRHNDGCSGGGEGVNRGKVKADDVSEAVTLAARGQPFDVIYYPRASTPEFCVRGSLVKSALQIRWCPGMRFKMAFETEDSSRISWFMGTISSAQVADPILWPDSPWRLLQVTWDEPDLLQNVKRVNPWLVELVSNIPAAVHFSPFSPPPHKKLRVPLHSEFPLFPLDARISLPPFSVNPFGCLPNNTPAGMQGARHPQYGLSLADIHRNNAWQSSGLLPAGFRPHNQSCTSFGISSSVLPKLSGHDNVSCLLTIGNPSQGTKILENGKAAPFLLFGQTILPDNQTCRNRCNDTCASDGNCNVSDESGSALTQTKPCKPSSGEGFQLNLGLDTGLCKVFIEFEDVGRTLDLALLNSYDELYSKVANMFGIEVSDMQNRVLYRDAADKVRPLGDEPFSNFAKTARRLTILTNLEQR